MTKEELKHLTSDCEYFLNGRGEINLYNFIENLRTTYIEPKENRIAELKLKLEALEGQIPWKDIKDKSELIKEIAELKAEKGCETCCKFSEEQLTKAKEKMSNLLEIIERPYQFNAPQKIQMIKEAEQFLKE